MAVNWKRRGTISVKWLVTAGQARSLWNNVPLKRSATRCKSSPFNHVLNALFTAVAVSGWSQPNDSTLSLWGVGLFWNSEWKLCAAHFWGLADAAWCEIKKIKCGGRIILPCICICDVTISFRNKKYSHHLRRSDRVVLGWSCIFIRVNTHTLKIFFCHMSTLSLSLLLTLKIKVFLSVTCKIQGILCLLLCFFFFVFRVKRKTFSSKTKYVFCA